MNLKCLICNNPLTLDNNTYKCCNNHCFDQSKYGYTNFLISNKKNHGDDTLMVNTRYDFLTHHYYDFLVNQLNNIFQQLNIHCLLDYACGPGYYLSQFNVDDKVGIDISKKAIEIASRHDKSSHYYVANGYNLPFFTQSFDAISIIFAPYDATYLSSFIKDNGYLIVVKPDVYHLIELKQQLYNHIILNDGEIDTLDNYKIIHEYHINEKSILSNLDLYNLLTMTPYYYKTKQADKDKLNKITSLEMTFSFIITVYQKI